MTNPRVQLLTEAADDCIDCANYLLEQAPNMGRTKEAHYRRQASDCEARARELRDWANELAPGGSQTQPNIAVGESGTAAASSVDAEFLSLVGHCSNCGCADCREFFRAHPEPKAPQLTSPCQHDETKPDCSLSWVGSWDVSGDSRYVCRGCRGYFRRPSAHAQNR